LHILKKICFSRKTTPFEFFLFFNRKEAFTEAKNIFSWSAGLILPNDVKKREKIFYLKFELLVPYHKNNSYLFGKRRNSFIYEKQGLTLVPLLWHHTLIFMATCLSRKSKSIHVCSICLSTSDILCCFEKCQNEFLLSQMWFTIHDHRRINQKMFYE